METVVGLIVGAIVTVLAAQYYYRRTVNKELSVYQLLNSLVFAGIAKDVREQLHFSFKDQEVQELQQVVFLVANTGDRAIRDLIHPLTLTFPANAKILDASIVHRHPANLQVELNTKVASESEGICFKFPLLNKGEHFVVKLLLSGKVPFKRLSFDLLSDDLPRTIQAGFLPPSAFAKRRYRIEWSIAALAGVLLAVPVWIAYTLFVLSATQPSIFPIPWDAYIFNWDTVGILVPAVLIGAFFSIVGLVAFGASLFGGEFPPPKGPHFPLPKEIREAVYPFNLSSISNLGEPEMSDELTSTADE